jgi:flavin reductase (DIM6/NTAB) family NADH-FMN oxidoreductase RutF
LSLQFAEVRATELQDNPFRAIGKEWMLITAGTPSDFNTMTASWGAWGELWNRQVAICFIRPQRHTFSFAEAASQFTLCFFDEAWRSALDFCGSHSGRQVDKVAATGLTTMPIAGGGIGFEEARLILVCRKLYAGDFVASGFVDSALRDEIYPGADYHRMFVGEVSRCMVSGV